MLLLGLDGMNGVEWSGIESNRIESNRMSVGVSAGDQLSPDMRLARQGKWARFVLRFLLRFLPQFVPRLTPVSPDVCPAPLTD